MRVAVAAVETKRGRVACGRGCRGEQEGQGCLWPWLSWRAIGTGLRVAVVAVHRARGEGLLVAVVAVQRSRGEGLLVAVVAAETKRGRVVCGHGCSAESKRGRVACRGFSRDL